MNIVQNLKMYFLVILAVLALPFALAFGGRIAMKPKNWKTSRGTTYEKNEREKQRGTLVSVLGALLLSFIMMVMTDFLGRDTSTVKFRYGFILGPIIGYVLDRGIGSDIGLKYPFTFAFASLYDWAFIRYLITVLIDMFISDPILDGLKVFFKPEITTLMGSDFWLYRTVGKNAMNILQSLVGFITFQAYTNQSRFNWAYAPKDLPMAQRYKGITIILITALSSVMYLTANISGANSNSAESKIPVVLFTFFLLSVLSQYNELDGPYEEYCEVHKETEGPESSEDTESNAGNKCKDEQPKSMHVIIGIIMFAIFVLFGFVSPLFVPQNDANSEFNVQGDGNDIIDVKNNIETKVEELNKKLNREDLINLINNNHETKVEELNKKLNREENEKQRVITEL